MTERKTVDANSQSGAPPPHVDKTNDRRKALDSTFGATGKYAKPVEHPPGTNDQSSTT